MSTPPNTEKYEQRLNWELIRENDILVFIYFKIKSHSLEAKALALQQNRNLEAFQYILKSKKVQIKLKYILKIFTEIVSQKLNIYVSTALYNTHKIS